MFLQQRYGANLAEKMSQIFQIAGGNIDYPEFCEQISQILAQRSLQMQLAFDLFDCNNDDKLTECDLFKSVYAMRSNPIFESVLLKDIAQITQAIDSMTKIKRQQLLAENG